MEGNLNGDCLRKEWKKTLSTGELSVTLEQVGEDILLRVRGGEKPHIGCVVMSIPRPSLTGDGSVSCTSSVLSVIGHKDEAICRMLAEKAAVCFGTTAVCAGGVHVDYITKEQMKEILEAVQEAADKLFP